MPYAKVQSLGLQIVCKLYERWLYSHYLFPSPFPPAPTSIGRMGVDCGMGDEKLVLTFSFCTKLGAKGDIISSPSTLA